jgi:hypothetical protein
LSLQMLFAVAKISCERSKWPLIDIEWTSNEDFLIQSTQMLIEAPREPLHRIHWSMFRVGYIEAADRGLDQTSDGE